MGRSRPNIPGLPYKGPPSPPGRKKSDKLTDNQQHGDSIQIPSATESPSSPSIRTTGSFFSQAQDLQIIGGTFTIVDGNVHVGGFDSGVKGSPPRDRDFQVPVTWSNDEEDIRPDFKRLDTLNIWIGADHALQHLNQHRIQIAREFSNQNIGSSHYALYAGFDDSLIRSGVGYLEQIHVFTSAHILPESPLLSSLGRICSPFSSILYTSSSKHMLPVFKDDGTQWEYDELVFHTAAKFVDRGTTAVYNPTVISLLQSMEADSLSSTAQSDASGRGTRKGKGKGKGKGKWTGKGKEKGREGGGQNTGRGKEDTDEDNRESDEDDDMPGGDPDPDPPNSTGEPDPSRPIEISFNVTSEILSTTLEDDRRSIFQFLTLQGKLTIHDSAPTITSVYFTRLKFGTTSATPPSTAYQQDHLRITVDSRCDGSFITVHKPQRTLAFNRETKVISGTKTTKQVGGSLGASLGFTSTPHATMTLAGSTSRVAENSAGLERTAYTSRITQQDVYGVAMWGFAVDDQYAREGGINLSDDILPSVTFEWPHSPSRSSVNIGRPNRVDVEVASYWSIIPQQTQGLGWLTKILSYSTSQSGDVPYSNLCQILVLSIPQRPAQDSSYTATVQVANQSNSLNSAISSPNITGQVEFAPRLKRNVGKIEYDNLVEESSLDLSSIRLAHRVRTHSSNLRPQGP